MSHFTKCALKMTNLAAIKKALEDMQLKFNAAEENQSVKVRGYQGDSLQAEISIDMGRYDVGIVNNQDGTYGAVADWWGRRLGDDQGDLRRGVPVAAQPALPVSQRQTGLRREGLRRRRGSERGGRLDPAFVVRKWVNE